MKIGSVWVVRDPGPQSELGDVVWQTTTKRLHYYVAGATIPTWEREHHAMYTERDEALADALLRVHQLQPRLVEAFTEQMRARYPDSKVPEYAAAIAKPDHPSTCGCACHGLKIECCMDCNCDKSEAAP